MPRRARMYLPGHPYHIVQRGNNREVCFIEPENYQFYLELWQECACRYGVAMHAYCLMTNHIHVLVTTGGRAGIGRVLFSQFNLWVSMINCSGCADHGDLASR